ncbi:unnamed protein product [Lactuca saligna]|uniref:Uncharacterized protein n=2 Tax=Lactuca saligna TaxID=75948 RepID=A0AA36EE07_LACSI|nr:unnamed protein product [Lactuca saligna]
MSTKSIPLTTDCNMEETKENGAASSLRKKNENDRSLLQSYSPSCLQHRPAILLCGQPSSLPPSVSVFGLNNTDLSEFDCPLRSASRLVHFTEVENVGRNGLSLRKDSWIRHPKATSLRTVSLSFPNLCARLFDGNNATGNFRSYSTQSSSVVGASSCRVPPLQIMSTPFLAIDDDGDDTSHHASEHFHEPPPSPASPDATSPSVASPYTGSPSSNPSKRAKPSTPIAPSASPSASSHDRTSITTDDLAFEMKKVPQSLTKGYTIPQFLE